MSENNEMAPVVEPVIENVVVEQRSVVEEAPKMEEPKVEAPIVEEVKPEPVKTPTPTKSNTVVLYSLKDLNIDGLGSLKKGYNKVSESDAKKWLVKNAVRVATEKEIQTYLK